MFTLIFTLNMSMYICIIYVMLYLYACNKVKGFFPKKIYVDIINAHKYNCFLLLLNINLFRINIHFYF